MCTAFRFDGVVALLGHEIDLLVTPDPIVSPDVLFEPVTDYELMLVEHEAHPLAARAHVKPQDLLDEELIAVPVSIDRLDIYTRFLGPAHCTPRSHRTAESTDLMLQLVAAGRGVAVLPDWLVREDRAGLPVRDIRLGKHGIDKSINVGGGGERKASPMSQALSHWPRRWEAMWQGSTAAALRPSVPSHLLEPWSRLGPVNTTAGHLRSARSR